ncbi:hypothetical protein FG386_002211 [Cryptosporidium ryanae]|uniref:uncharacterized protein n=1 Tax=Cryptosporidium ryanae TaxID=515981 RepID=UPI003519EE3E|nr:hypothetical protein FG386_002211 [Cryptosporidium ryanae]
MRVAAFRLVVLFLACYSFSNICTCSGNPGYSGRISVLKGFCQLIQNELKNGLDRVIFKIKEAYGNEYFDISMPVQDFHNDSSTEEELVTHIPSEFQFHIPAEVKEYSKFSTLKYLKPVTLGVSETPIVRKIRGMDRKLPNNELLFPRIKHFRKNLPKITSEPYQRLMTFAIEVCLIPSLWYIELIHCMFMGAAPYFEGMLSSYSLQDIVGSSVKTIGYLDENFSIENCYYSVSMFSDDKVSPYYMEICEAMKDCLVSKDFKQEKYAKLRAELGTRMLNVHVFNFGIEGSLLRLSKYFIRTSLLFESNDTFPTKNHVERNFLPVRVMLASTITCTIRIIIYPESTYSLKSLVKGLFYIFSTKTLFDTKIYMKYCKSFLKSYLQIKATSAEVIYEFLCKEFLSIGFVDNKVDVLSENLEMFVNATMPKRVLDQSYYTVIPEMFEEKGVSEYSREWISYSTSDEGYDRIEAKRKPAVKKTVYTSKMLKKTRRKVRTKVIPEVDTQKDSSKRTKRTVFKTRMTKVLTRKFKRESDLISDQIFSKKLCGNF